MATCMLRHKPFCVSYSGPSRSDDEIYGRKIKLPPVIFYATASIMGFWICDG